MIDYLALMEHLPVILVVTAVLALLIGVPYLLTTMLLRSQKERDSDVRS
jgi:hypothetical protein